MNAICTALVVATAALTLACGSTSNGAESMPDSGFRTLLRGYDSGIQQGGVRLARDEAEWTRLWTEHTQNRLPESKPPSVDFEREMVALVTLGTRSSGGYAIEVTKVFEDGGELIVEAIETKPGKDAIVPMVVTTPYHLISTARRDATKVTLKMR